MPDRSTFGRIVAVALVIALQALFTPMAAEGEATMSGHVLSLDGSTPLTGAVVHATDPVSGALYSSEPTNEKGYFEIPALEPSNYSLGVEKDGGLYLLPSTLGMAPGQQRSVALAIQPAPLAPGQNQPPNVTKSGPKGWNSPWAAALIVLGGVIVLGLVIDAADDDTLTTTSPSTPYND